MEICVIKRDVNMCGSTRTGMIWTNGNVSELVTGFVCVILVDVMTEQHIRLDKWVRPIVLLVLRLVVETNLT